MLLVRRGTANRQPMEKINILKNITQENNKPRYFESRISAKRVTAVLAGLFSPRCTPSAEVGQKSLIA